MPATTSAATASAPSAASRGPQLRPRTIPTFTRPPGTGATPTYPSRNTRIRASARGSPGRSSRWKVRPTRGASRAGRATPAARATIELPPSAPTTSRAACRTRPSTVRTWSTGRGPSRSTASTRAPAHTVAPAARASSRSAGSSADRSNPTGSPSPYGRRKAIPVGVSTRIAGMGRATRASVASSRPTPAERGDRGGRREHAAGSPAVRRASLEHGDVEACAGQQRRDDCPGRPAADDRDVRSRSRDRGCGDRGGRRDRDDRVALPERRGAPIDRFKPGPAQQLLDFGERVRPPDGQQRIMARVVVPGEEPAGEPRPEQSEAAAMQVVDDHTRAG